jgi:hypothetical protein
MIAEAWWRLLMLPVIVVAAFGLFCLLLVVLLIGYVDPSSSPRAEFTKLADVLGRVERWWRRSLLP